MAGWVGACVWVGAALGAEDVAGGLICTACQGEHGSGGQGGQNLTHASLLIGLAIRTNLENFPRIRDAWKLAPIRICVNVKRQYFDLVDFDHGERAGHLARVEMRARANRSCRGADSAMNEDRLLSGRCLLDQVEARRRRLQALALWWTARFEWRTRQRIIRIWA